MKNLSASAAALALTIATSTSWAGVTLGPASAPLGPGRVSLAWKATDNAPMNVELRSLGRADRVVTSTATDGVHYVRIGDLEPGAEYSYTVGDREGRFMAPPGENQPVHFGVFGDTRDGDQVHKRIVEQLVAERPDFYVMTGDVLIDGDPNAAWQHFFDIQRPLMSVAPFTVVHGNHDGDISKFGQLVTPQDETESWRSYGSMTFGVVHFLLIDTEQSVGPGTDQYAFIKKDLAENQDRPLIAMLHKPLFSTGVHGGDESLQKSLAPLFQKYGVDVVFQGHDHMYERSSPINGVTYIVTGGGGAPLYGAGVADWTRVMEGINHYLVVDASASRIHIEAKRLDGSQIDSVDVDPTANNAGKFANIDSLPDSGGGCLMALNKPGSYRREGTTTAALGSFGPMLGFVAVRGVSRRRTRRRKP